MNHKKIEQQRNYLSGRLENIMEIACSIEAELKSSSVDGEMVSRNLAGGAKVTYNRRGIRATYRDSNGQVYDIRILKTR